LGGLERAPQARRGPKE